MTASAFRVMLVSTARPKSMNARAEYVRTERDVRTPLMAISAIVFLALLVVA